MAVKFVNLNKFVYNAKMAFILTILFLLTKLSQWVTVYLVILIAKLVAKTVIIV